jgi:hypothetical protein
VSFAVDALTVESFAVDALVVESSAGGDWVVPGVPLESEVAGTLDVAPSEPLPVLLAAMVVASASSSLVHAAAKTSATPSITLQGCECVIM